MSMVVGDVVRKKSGGPKMDVEAPEGTDAFRCSWIDAAGQYQWEVFPTVTLEKVEPRAPRNPNMVRQRPKTLRGW